MNLNRWAAGLVLLALLTECAFAAGPPAPAAAAGYTVNTFSSDFTPATVDIGQSGNSGFSWYPWNLFGHRTNTAAIKFNADHSIMLMGDTTGPNGELVSAAPSKTAAQFVGTAFGGGLYVEAELKFNPDDVAKAGSKGWPSFWALPLESSVLKSAAQWPGQPPGYVHSVEVDIFEYLFLPYGVPRNFYGAAMHDWYGIPNVTCARGLCAQHMPSDEGKRRGPEGIDFSQFHRFGFLWVPATDSASGFGRFLFDGQSMGPDRQWTKYNNQPPPPTNQPWAFGWLDQQHLILILGTGPGEPMTVRAVNVWQRSASQNLHQ